MNKKSFKELFSILFFSILNIIIAFTITKILGISNIILLKTYMLTFGNVTFEVIIFLFLSLIEIILYELYKYLKNKNNNK